MSPEHIAKEKVIRYIFWKEKKIGFRQGVFYGT